MIKLLKKSKDTPNTKSLSNLSSRTHKRLSKPKQNTRIIKENTQTAPETRRERNYSKIVKSDNKEFYKKTAIWSSAAIGGIAFIFIISFTFLTLANVVLTHPYFEIKNVEVTGTSQFTNEEIIQLSGLEESTNYFALDENSIESRMLQNTWIENVNISKSFPDTVHLEVQERQPYFWILHNEELFYIDALGQILAPVKADNFVSLPILDLGVSPEEALLELPEFIKALDARVNMLPFSLNEISWIRLSAGNGIEMYWEDEKILLSYSLDNPKENLDKMIFALQDLSKRNEISKIAEIHAGNNQVWFVYD